MASMATITASSATHARAETSMSTNLERLAEMSINTVRPFDCLGIRQSKVSLPLLRRAGQPGSVLPC